MPDNGDASTVTSVLKNLFRSKKPAPGVQRQGDVFIVPLNELPDGLTGARPVLAEGEVTGHSHRISDPATAQVLVRQNRMYLRVTASSATIVHEEHGPLTIPKGSYEVRIQREYHPQEIRRVVD